MASHLVIVESPAKAKTIEKYLGKDFKVLASYGHVRDLIPKEGAVETDNGFKMNYTPVERNQKHVANIKKELKKADSIYLATDPDREGEAISWHLYEMLREKNLMKNKRAYRVAFYEITKQAVSEAIEPSSIPVKSPWTWSTRNRRAGRSTTWLVSIFRRCCGARFDADCRLVACRVRHCA